MAEAFTLVHLSDLHVGKGPRVDQSVREWVETLVAAEVDHVVVTGDVTHRGRARELATFDEAFAPLAASGRLTVVPGNHDRLGDDVGQSWMDGARVRVGSLPGLFLVQLDSTGPHNRAYTASYGQLTLETVGEVKAAFEAARSDQLAVLLMHHHPVPLPEDSWHEWLWTRLGSRHSEELEHGWALVEQLRGWCDLILHGHRHVAQGRTLFEGDPRPLHVSNAGASAQLRRAEVFVHAGGQLLSRDVIRPVRLAPAMRFLPLPALEGVRRAAHARLSPRAES